MFLGFNHKRKEPDFGLDYHSAYEYFYNTKIPKGKNLVIHHVNGNHYDNNQYNLRLMKRSDHDLLHKRLAKKFNNN